MVAVQVGEDCGYLPAENSEQGQFRRLEDCHLDVGDPGGRRGFQADPARTDDRDS